MAVQTLAKDQAKREKKNQKDLDKKFQEDEENALKDTQRMIDLMEKIYKRETLDDNSRKVFDDISSDSYKKLKKKVIPGPGGVMIEAKSGGQIKCGVQMKGTSPLIKKRKGKK
jgi:hypothetical protein